MPNELSDEKLMKTVEATRTMVEDVTGKTVNLTNLELLDIIKKVSTEVDAVFGRTIGAPKEVAEEGVDGIAKIILLTGVMNDYANQLKGASAMTMSRHATPEGLQKQVDKILKHVA